MDVTPASVRAEYEWVRERAPRIADLINETRADLEGHFDVEVDRVSEAQVRDAVDDAFADGDRAVNAAALAGLLRDLDVDGDYPGFVVDELLGRELAATVAGDQPLRLLAEATFHVADVRTHGGPDEAAGADDLDAALAAGLQGRIPGWPWQEGPSPFAVESG